MAYFGELFNVRRRRVIDPIPLGRMAADDIEKIECIKLRQLPL